VVLKNDVGALALPRASASTRIGGRNRRQARQRLERHMAAHNTGGGCVAISAIGSSGAAKIGGAWRHHGVAAASAVSIKRRRWRRQQAASETAHQRRWRWA